MKTVFLTLLIFSMAHTAWAARVAKVQGKKVLITLEGENYQSGQTLYAVNSAGKRTGLIRIQSVKGSRALGQILKGRAVAGSTLAERGTPAKKQSTEETPDDGLMESGRSGQKGYGVLLGFATQSMSLKVGGADTNLKGTAFSVKGYYDYDLNSSLKLRLAAGLEPFSVKGTTVASCSGSTSCTAEYTYLGFEGFGQYNITKGPTRWWAGVGYSFLVAASKKVNIAEIQSSGSSNQIMLIGFGADFKMGKATIPFSLEYGMFPGSTNVKASSIFIRSGYGF